VEPPTALLIGSIADDFHRRSVRPKPVSNYQTWSTRAFHLPLEKLRCRFAISALRSKDLQHIAFVIYGAPQIMRLAIDPDEHLFQVLAPLRK
jgi:hypothetical protein